MYKKMTWVSSYVSEGYDTQRRIRTPTP